MHQDITDRIEQYLTLETNYALIINGDYGIGKSYYIKNELFPTVKKLNVPNTVKEEKYLPILISLFGAKSIEDIQNQIFLELFPVLKSRGAKIAKALVNVAFKYINNNIDEFITDSGTSSEFFNDYSQILICIDDIDRKSKDLDLKEVYGFVNNLVENFGAKIILIANEDELRNEIDIEKDNYSLLREKVIGISISFKSDVSQVYDEIITSKYKDPNEPYFNFLKDEKNTIISRILQNNSNLRNLLFFLEHFKIIFIGMTSFFEENDVLKGYELEILNQLLEFTLPISIEYKSGKLKPEYFQEVQDLYKNAFFDISAFLIERDNGLNDLEGRDNSYAKTYKEKYLKNSSSNKISYFDSIFKYITGSNSFNANELISEINTIFQVEDNRISEKERVTQKLSYWQCLDLSLKEYRNLTNQLLEFVDHGEIKLDQYPNIFHLATRFNNILNFNLDKLKARFIKGIRNGTFAYIHNLDFYLSISGDTEYYDYLNDIRNYCLEINFKTKTKIEDEEIESLFELFKNDMEEFCAKINDTNSLFNYSPVFIRFNLKKFWRTLKKVRGSELVTFGFGLKNRYRKYVHESFSPEIEFLEFLKTRLEEEIKKPRTKKLDKIAFEFLLNITIVSLQNFK